MMICSPATPDLASQPQLLPL